MRILLLRIVALISWQAGTLVSVQNHKADTNRVKPVVVVDTGRGGDDPGKVGINGQLERDISLKIAQHLRECLEAADVKVVLARDPDQRLHNSGDGHKKMAGMHRRCEVIDKANPDLVVNTHQNSYHEEYVSGGQVFYYKTLEKGKYLAEFLQRRFDYVLGEASRRLAEANDNYYLLLHVKTPIVTVECGFLSNSGEAVRLEEEDCQDKMIWAIHMGIPQYLNTVRSQTVRQ